MLKRVEIFIKGLLLGASSFILKKGRVLTLPMDVNTIRKLLIIRPQKIGDFLVILPLVDRLRRENREIEILTLTSRDCRSLIQGDRRFAKVFYFSKNPFRLAFTLVRIRREKPDLTWDMVGRDSATFLWLSQIVSRSAVRVGMGKSKLAKFYDLNFDHRYDRGSHIISNILEALKFWGITCEASDSYSTPHISESGTKAAGDYFGLLKGKYPQGYIIGMNISAGGKGRLWPEEAYKKLTDLLLKEASVSAVVIFYHGQDRKKAEKIRGTEFEKVYLIPDNLDLLTVSAIIKLMDIFISPDTSLVHIARGFKIPVVAMYNRYMENYRQWYPVGQEEGAVVSDSENDILSITPRQVADTALKLFWSGRQVK